ncbi:lipopolysaccharide biosynthesis protein [Novosphingobium sp. FGD1]|uniref:Lipopolysaccharide biosynthesis protein n=1 Tax=Novosphingobium silvae TaxID=2692619 RepID=A0A7X4GDF2_9SPHN|nr:Wzz/FepE/Etk N-terminal domain-containing protein [Novosphingobium silvae]MYL96603.1 lipopolysaccharide biosynthesis protein [Novosphingobium silvae]
MNSTISPSGRLHHAGMRPEPEGFALHPAEVLNMLRRRWRWLIAPTVLGAVAGVAVIATREPVYRSTATLLIDSPQIPTNLVASPLTDIADERIAKIRQQIVSRDSLTGLIDRNGLYPEERAGIEEPKLLDLMRGAVGVNLVAANQNQGRGGGTIAFNLSFDYSDAQKARAVTEQLTRMFIVEDKRFRTEQASGTAAFLAQRSGEMRRQLAELDARRRGVEARYAGSLPSDVSLSSQSSSALRAEISRTDAETQGLVQQSGLLAARQQELERSPPAGAENLHRAEERLARLLATHSEKFPDVIAARAEVERQKASLSRQPASSTMLIQAEIAASRERIATLASRRAELVGTLGELDRRIAMAPQSAYELNQIGRDYDNIKRQYESLRDKQLEAQVAANLQSEDKGERFTVVDPPNLPLHPLGSPRWMVLLQGIAAGFFLGLALVVGRELFAGIIHGAESLRRAVRAPILGTLGTTSTTPAGAWLPGLGGGTPSITGAGR